MTDFEARQRRAMQDAGRSSFRPRPAYAREQSALDAWKRERELNTATARLMEYARRGQLGPTDEDKPDPLGR
jgi:hypothetical protein